jgi:transposase
MRKRRDARGFGKHGKVLRWHVVQLHVDHGWTAREICAHFRGGTNLRLISFSTVRRVVRIYDETGDVCTPSGGRRFRPATTVTGEDWLYLQSVSRPRRAFRRQSRIVTEKTVMLES